MVENIPQVSYMETSHWPKDMHLGYAKNVVRRVDEKFDEDHPAIVKLQDEITPMKTAIAKEDEDYEQSRKADQTEAIRQADDERDALLNQALTVIDAMVKVSAIPASQQAAQVLQGTNRAPSWPCARSRRRWSSGCRPSAKASRQRLPPRRWA